MFLQSVLSGRSIAPKKTKVATKVKKVSYVLLWECFTTLMVITAHCNLCYIVLFRQLINFKIFLYNLSCDRKIVDAKLTILN